jgi:hypothetical protein
LHTDKPDEPRNHQRNWQQDDSAHDRQIPPDRIFWTEAGLTDIRPLLVVSKPRVARYSRATIGAPPPQPHENSLLRVPGASAEVVKISDDKSELSFGKTVTLRRDDGREHTVGSSAR